MKSSSFLLAALLTLGTGSVAFAQTSPPQSAPPTSVTNTPTTVPGTRATTENGKIATTPDGANISNNRDRLSSGTGTPATMAADNAAERSAKQAERKARKGKMKSK
ncbi:hypothetical protein Q5H93_21100 [Hymenobacter sp. ASUV-10]|uniref:Uncharacterized protein n=1 Tax=Hymenobacter aranciens TaxID=3063996 RepID=A0ABT9BJS7_9BACT|nr:hypothetical protein [Hymenobacter sp. ASUV-10]MDO7877257.1 hypothetical protein [Hymenobacter sp. ASUV-10]